MRAFADGGRSPFWYAAIVTVDTFIDGGLLEAVRRFAREGEAPALLRLAVDIVGADLTSERHREEVLHICRALAGEGRLVRQMAEEIARELVTR